VGGDQRQRVGDAMKGCLQVGLWVVAWPILLPIWLWGKGSVGKVVAGVFVVILIVTGLASPATEREQDEVVLSVTTRVPTFTPTIMFVSETPVLRVANTPMPVETPVVTVANTPESKPTETVVAEVLEILTVPVLTPSLPATPTPTPTEVLIPTVIPTAELPSNVARYVWEVTNKIDDIGQSFNNLSNLLQLPRIGQDDWTIDIAVELVAIQYVHRTLSEMNIPPEIADIHATLLQGTSRCDEATHLIASGLDNISVDDLNLANARMSECRDGITASGQQLIEYVSKYNMGQSLLQETPSARDRVTVVNGDANLRGGPGTEFAVAGSASIGQSVDVVARNQAGDWLQLANGLWIAAFLIDGAPGELPVVE
jgi:hypothetical protein